MINCITPKEYRCQCANYSVESGFMNMTEVLFSISQNSLHSLHNFPCPIKHFQSAIYNICLLFWLWCKIYHCQDNYSEMNKLIVVLKPNLNFTGRLDNHNGIGELTFLSHGSWDFCFCVCNHVRNKIQVTKNSSKSTVFSR